MGKAPYIAFGGVFMHPGHYSNDPIKVRVQHIYFDRAIAAIARGK